MAEDNLEIVIVARDKASKTIKGIGSTMKSAFKVGAIAATGGLALLTVGIGGIIKLGMEGERVQAQLNAVIESTGGVAGLTADEINAMSDSLSRVTPFTQDAIIEAQSLLLTFTNIGEDVFPQASEAVLNMATVFGSTEQAAIQIGKALNDPVQGVTALRRVGVQLTDEQEKLVKQLVATGDVAGAQAIILGELETEFGGAARAAGDTFGGKLTILKNKLLDVFEGIGLQLMPVLGLLVDSLIDDLIPAAEKLGQDVWPDINSAIQAAAGFFSELWTVLEPLIFDTIIPFVRDHAEAFKAALIAIGAVLAGAAIVGGILSITAAIAALANPITAVILAVGLLAMAWTEDWGGIRTYITETVWPALKPVLESIRNWISVNLPIAIAYLKLIWKYVLLPALQSLVDFWNDTLKPTLIKIAMWLSINIPLAIAFAKDAWQTLRDKIQSIIDWYVSDLRPILNEVASKMDTLWKTALGVAKDAWQTLQDKMQELLDWWFTDMRPIVNEIASKMDTAWKTALGIAETAWGTLKDKMAEIKSYWDDTLKPVFDAVVTMLDTTLDTAVADAKGFLDDLAGGFDAVWSAVDTVTGAISSMLTGILNLWDKIPGPLKPGSPPPFAIGLSSIADEMSRWNKEMAMLQNNMVSSPALAAVASQQTTTNNQQQYILNVQSNSSQENLRRDFETMKTWGRL